LHKQPNIANIAVIGAGYWGKNLVRNFYGLGVLKTIYDINYCVEKEFRQKYPSLTFAKDLNTILLDPTIKAVVIATPAETHYWLVKEALLANKHIFVEKPLALNTEQGQELVSLAQDKSSILMVGHILQYHPAILKLKEIIDQGELGKIQYIYSNRLSIGKIRAEENILWSFAPHDISIILMLLDEFPVAIQANGGEYLQSKIADVTMSILEFKSGVKGHIFVSWLHPFKDQKLIIVGDRKMAVFDDVSDKKLLLYPHKIEWKNRIPVANKAQPEIVPIQKQEPLQAECQHFLDCIEGNKQPRTDGQEGLRVLQVLSACQESFNNHGKKVFINGFTSELIKNKQNSLYVHPTAMVDEECQVGKNTRIWHFSHVMKGSAIGRDCRIGQNVVIGPNANIGNGCKIQNNISVYEGVTLEDNVFCGPSMVFTNVLNPS